jgi:hypothetical protein
MVKVAMKVREKAEVVFARNRRRLSDDAVHDDGVKHLEESSYAILLPEEEGVQ